MIGFEDDLIPLIRVFDWVKCAVGILLSNKHKTRGYQARTLRGWFSPNEIWRSAIMWSSIAKRFSKWYGVCIPFLF